MLNGFSHTFDHSKKTKTLFGITLKTAKNLSAALILVFCWWSLIDTIILMFIVGPIPFEEGPSATLYSKILLHSLLTALVSFLVYEIKWRLHKQDFPLIILFPIAPKAQPEGKLLPKERC